MNAAPVGRNDPCPCGSGKKYKKCCIAKEEIVRAAPAPGTGQAPPGMYESPIDQLSNRAAEAIDAGRYDEAETLCRNLLEKYPDQLDGHDRFGMLREAQGRFKEAADHYTKAIEMIGGENSSAARETIDYLKERQKRALAKHQP